MVSFTTPAALSPRKETPVLIGYEWVGLDAVETRKILHCRESDTGLPARIPSIYQLSYPDYN
jgi:hypothetical protein